MLDKLEALPKKKTARTLPPRGPEKYVTVHYSGVDYNHATPEQERQTIVDETVYHLSKNWGRSSAKPVYGDGLMYDYVVLRSGEAIRTRRSRQQLWHCANVLGNATSWAVHVMTGPTQKLTRSQKTGLYSLIDTLRAQCNIPRNAVVGHCEWERGTANPPVVSDRYVIQKDQGPCPEQHVMEDVLAYRAMQDVSETRQLFEIVGNVPDTYVYTDRSFASSKAVIEDNFVYLAPGTVIEVDDITDEWAHLSSEIGFVPLTFLKEIKSDDPEPPAVPVVPTVVRDYNEQSSIVIDMQPVANPEGIIRFLAGLPDQTYSEEDIRVIVMAYKIYGEANNVDWVLALAQNLHETANLRSWWAQRPRRNPAGLRVTGERRAQKPENDSHWDFDPEMGMWRKGMSFSSWDASVRAHITYLLSYARTNDRLNPAQAAFMRASTVSFVLDRSVNRGVAPELIGLNGKWAVPGTTYATKIAAIADRLTQKE